MATISSNATGLYSATGTWVGGVVPVEGDKVTIVSPHVVTVDNTFIVGDDTTTAFTINNGATLKASRTANSQITFKGTCTNNGVLDYGTSASPIPAGVTATIIGNYSATLLANKYTIISTSGVTNNLWMYGASHTVNTLSTATCNSAQAVLAVANATGWVVGDQIAVAGTVGNTQVEIMTISSISGLNITMTANFVNTHASGCYVSNVTSNVTIKPYNTSFSFLFATSVNAVTPINSREIQYVSFNNCTLQLIYTAVNAYSTYINLKNIGFNKGIAQFFGGYSYKDTLDSSVFYLGQTQDQAGATAIVSNTNFYNTGGNSVISNFSQGGISFLYDTCHFAGGPVILNLTSATGHVYKNCTFDNVNTVVQSSYGGEVNFNNCLFGMGVGTPLITTLYTTSAGGLEKTYFNNCTYGSITNMVSQAALNAMDSSNFAQLVNKNSDPTQQELYSRLGNYFRDNSTIKNSTSSLKMVTANTQTAVYTQTVPAPNGVAIKIAGNLQHDATYVSGAFTLPTVTISGLGITPQTFTAINSAGVWQPWTFTVTQTSGNDGNLTVTYSGQSATATGSVYFDGLISTVFVTYARFYGYIFNTATPILTTNTVTVASESTAGAYTGISIAGTTITITGTRTIRELYDYCQYYLTRSANLLVADFFTSTDGINFTSTYNITINGGSLTGTGTISMPTKTLTLSGGGTTSIIITDATGTHVYVTLTGMTANSRVQLYNLNTSTELYNAVVAATSLSFPFTWTTNVNLRVRIMYVSGITANIFYEVNAVITNVGVSLVVIPVNDTVYNGNGIDGSTITNVSINDSAMLVNVSTGTISWKKLYAYETYWLGTSAGIIDLGRFASAVDGSNYVWTGFKIKNTTSPSVPLNITGGWGRDSVTGLAQTLVDTTGGNVFSNPDQVIAFGSGLTPAQDAELTAIKANTDLIPATV